MNDQPARHARLRYTATGAVAALAAAGAIAGAVALAAPPPAKLPGHTTAATIRAVKAANCSAPDKTPAPNTPADNQPFLTAVQQLVNNGTITGAEGQVVDREIQAGRLETDTLTAAGFNQTQLQAVEQALGNVKRALAPGANGQSK
jgi:hypothetical protein